MKTHGLLTTALLVIVAASRVIGQQPLSPNIARYQNAGGSTYGYTFRPEAFATDGIASNFHRWRTTSANGHTLEITYPRDVTIASAHLYSGLISTGTSEVWGDFKFQYHNGTAWVDITGGDVSGNTAPERKVEFGQSATSNRFRLVNTESGNTVRSVRELAMFGPNVVDSVEQGYPLGTEVNVNLAHKRPATASSIDGSNYAIKAVDGYVDDASRWMCNSGVAGEWLEIDLLSVTVIVTESVKDNGDAYHAIGSARLYSGDIATSTNALSHFTIQYWDTVNNLWVDAPGGVVTGNTQTIRTIPFSSPVVTNKMRLVNNTTGSAKVAELQFFPPGSVTWPTDQDVRMGPPSTAKWLDYGDATRHLRVASASLKLGVIGGNAVFTNDGAGSDALNWQLLLNHRDGSYRIRNVKTGQCLALANLSTAANTAVIAETYTGMPHQCWFLDFVNGTQFRLLNAYSGLALQPLGGSTTPGVSLVVAAPNVSPVQQWDAVWQANIPKKGIAATGNPFFDVPGETFMSYFYGKFPHSSWSYSWGRRDSFPFMADHHTFHPMQWGNFFFAHSSSSSSASPLEGDRVYLQSQSKPLNFMGFNEPDHTDQANMSEALVLQRWPRLQSLDAPLVGPCPANPTSTWNATFYAAANQMGYRIDYTPQHWYARPDATSLINKIKDVYKLYGRPVWLTEFSCVRWSGSTPTWTKADTYNFLAEFMWRAENLPELDRYSLFNWKDEPTKLIDPPDAPRGNSMDANGNLTPFGELYASWDCIAQVLPQKAYHLHNCGQYQRTQSPATGDALQSVTPDNSSAGTQWFLTTGTTANTYRIQTTRDGRPLVCAGGTAVTMGATGQTNAQTEWTLVPVVSGENHDGWYYLQHPLTNQRLKNNGGGIYSMVAASDISNESKWRFVVPLVPEMKAVADSMTIIINQAALLDVLANDGGRTGRPSIQSVGTPDSGTAVIENGRIRYTPPNGFSGSAQLTYTITDGTVTDNATVAITVVSNTPPTVDVGPNLSATMSEPQEWTPTQIAKELWLDADDASTLYSLVSGGPLVTANGGAIGRWEDKSGNNRHATQSTAGSQPFLRTNAQNAKQVVDFDTNDVLNVGGSAFSTQNVFAVINYDGGAAFLNYPWVFGSKGTAPTDPVNPDVPALFGGHSGTNIASALPHKNAISKTLYVNGTVSSTGNVADLVTFDIVQASGASASPSRSNWLVGHGDFFWNGRFAELIILGGAISTENRQRMEGYLAHKWFGSGSNNSLPADHPYKSVVPQVTRTATATLNASATDVENDPLTYNWIKVDGPGTVTFANDSTASTTATFLANGTYTLRVTVSDSISSITDDIVITVKNLASVSDWPSASMITEGQALSAAVLSGGTASVAGSFTFDNPGAIPAVGTTSQAVTFTPTDSANYFSVSGAVNVTVQSAFDGWADTNGTGSETFGGDANGDGLADGLAWLIGATSPGQSSLSLQPSAQNSNGNTVLSFKRLNAAARGAALLKLEHSSLLTAESWTSILIPDDEGIVDGVQFSFTPDGEDHDQVQAIVPASKANGSGKLFIRLRGEAAASP